MQLNCPAWCSGGRRPLIAGRPSLQRLGVDLPLTRPVWDSNLGPPASESRPLANRAIGATELQSRDVHDIRMSVCSWKTVRERRLRPPLEIKRYGYHSRRLANWLLTALCFCMKSAPQSTKTCCPMTFGRCSYAWLLVVLMYIYIYICTHIHMYLCINWCPMSHLWWGQPIPVSPSFPTNCISDSPPDR